MAAGTRSHAVARVGSKIRRGFTLVEMVVVVIILGVLTMIIVPQFTNAAENPREKAVRDELHTVRAAIELYRAQHKDVTPDLSDSWTPLVSRTDADGGATGTPLFGPYLPKAPVNALTGGNKISAALDKGADWYWDPSSASIAALDSSRQIFIETP